MTKPTHEDALVLLNLMQYAAAADMASASRFVYGDQYIEDHDEFVQKYPLGTIEYSHVMLFCGYYETMGTLWKNGLFNEDLLFDWAFIAGPWNKVKGFALGVREEIGEPRILENFEALAAAQK